ncbi:MAG: clan AA aspartic protease [Chloroflexi bacterium]|nr:clan AA aspartic protease [Chloroflexota bacterium]
MDQGVVASLGESLRIYVNIAIYGIDGQRRPLRATLDTGFTEFLTLSGRAIDGLGLRQAGSSRMELGDSSVVYFESYLANVDWFGERRQITVHRSESVPTIGMKLLAHNDIHIRAIHNGTVSIKPITNED